MTLKNDVSGLLCTRAGAQPYELEVSDPRTSARMWQGALTDKFAARIAMRAAGRTNENGGFTLSAHHNI